MAINFDLARLHLEHIHDDGSRYPMEPAHHDAAQLDPEREWSRRPVFRCVECEQEVTLAPTETPKP